MTAPVRDWLPLDVVTDDSVVGMVEQAVVQWSARWLAKPFVQIATATAAKAAPWHDADDAGWRIHRTALAIRAPRQALFRLVSRVVDWDEDITSLKPGDRHVLEALERRLLEDLSREIEETFGISGEMRLEPYRVGDPLESCGGLIVSLAEPSGRDSLVLALPATVLFAAVKARLGAALPRTAPLQPLSHAFGTLNVPVEAIVGRAELTVAELNDLAIGDVLILDTCLDQAVEVAATRTHRVFAKAMLKDADDGMTLVFNV